jgi:hypothetical protein
MPRAASAGAYPAARLNFFVVSALIEWKRIYKRQIRSKCVLAHDRTDGN